jgi:hypothetical protein
MASNTFRSDPKRAAELAVILARHCADAAPHKVASLVCEMQAAARSAKRAAENACNYPMSEEQQARADKRQERAQAKINAALLDLGVVRHDDGSANGYRAAPTIELGGDPRGPCARLHIPGQRGDGWGDGFAVY